MRKSGIIRVAALILGMVVLTACSNTKTGPGEDTETETVLEEEVEKEELPEIGQVHLRDKDSLYENEDDTSVVTMYLTVSRGNSSENTDHTWEQINTYSAYDYNEMGVERYQVAGLLQVGDEEGPQAGELGYGEEVPNATVQIRGQTSSRNAQKSYKIELKKNKGLWNGQRTINLNKHMTDGMRFRNKLSYKLIQGIPQLMGLRTQFVHLYVKDLTEGKAGKFEDYGLYTQVEQLNQRGMKAHGLDSNGQLYKINFFEFFRYEDVIKLETDPDFNQEEFEKILEIKGNHDHKKLIRMLETLNDYSVSTDEILETYFDRENLLYWMAYHILTGNVDTQNRNVYLYSPQNSDTWYLISWDNDSSFSNTEYRVEGFTGKGSWESGISNYWGNVLLRRCLQSERFRRELDEVIQELKDYLSEERIGALARRYARVVMPYLSRMPDQMYAGLTPEQYEEILQALPGEVEENYQLYLESLEKPMPFFIGEPAIREGELHLVWEVAYDLDAEDIVYTVELARDYLFQDVIYHEEGQVFPEVSLELPPAGQYFVRIRATNESGQTQDAFDYYVTDEGKNFGMKCFYITEDGTVKEDVYEE